MKFDMEQRHFHSYEPGKKLKSISSNIRMLIAGRDEGLINLTPGFKNYRFYNDAKLMNIMNFRSCWSSVTQGSMDILSAIKHVQIDVIETKNVVDNSGPYRI